jgi:hypothetical protein
MSTFLFLSLFPALTTAFVLVSWLLSRRTDWGYEATLLAMRDAATESENEEWSRYLVSQNQKRSVCNVTLRGY